MANIIPVRDLNMDPLTIYNTRKEAQLMHMFEPEPGIFIVESGKCIERALEAGYQAISVFLEEELLRRIQAGRESQAPLLNKLILEADLPVYLAPHEVIKEVTGYNLTGGVLCAFHRRVLPTLEEVCGPDKNLRRIVILDDVENPTNVGSIFRNAAALHCDAILLNGGCSDPFYRRSSRVSMGTVFQIPWTVIKKGSDYIAALHDLGFASLAMALTDRSVSIDDPAIHAEEKLAIIMGNEGEGLPEQTIAQCDYTVCIPMSHGVDSLNVASASAVAIWELCK